LSKLDSEQRPLFTPRANAFNPAGIADNLNAQGPVGEIMNLQVVLDPNISTVGGTTSAFVIRSHDLMFFTSGPVARVLHEPLGARLSVLLQIYSFNTLISRYPASVVEITDYSTAAVCGS
jgi:hypothetical protein